MPSNARYRPVDAAKVPRFSDVATFMRARRLELSSEVDIALLGVPFDMGVNYRAGARHGPSQVREMSRIIRQVHPSTNIAPFDLCNIADVGDAPVNALDMLKSVDMIQHFVEDIHAAGAVPLAIGGDHTVPLPIIRALARETAIGVVQFDAHADTLDQLLGTKINHATFMRRGVEEGLIDPKRVIQIGLRGSRFSAEDVQFGYDTGMRLITMDEYEELGRAAVIQEIDRLVGNGPTYVTFDIDALDPSHAIGTGVPESGGLSVRDCQVMLRSLRGKHLVGADICEVAPPFDPSGLTALNAANLMFELLCVMAESVDNRRQ